MRNARPLAKATNSSSRTKSRSTGVGVWLFLSTAVALPILALAATIIWTSQPLPELEHGPEPTLLLVKKTVNDDALKIQLNLTWGKPVSLAAPAWTGVITGLPDPTASHELSTGSQVVQIDGIWRIAARTDRPFHASVSRDSAAADTGALNSLLERLQLEHGNGATWTMATQRGVNTLAKNLGAASEPATMFDPAWVIWIPSEPLYVESNSLQIGALAAPSANDVLMGRSPLTDVSIETSDTHLPRISAQDWQISLADSAVSYSGLAEHATQEVGKLGELIDGIPKTAEATLRRKDPISAWTVPPSAVLTDAHGNFCLVLRKGAGWAGSKIDVVGGDVSRTRVVGSFPDSIRVLANPTEVHEDGSCN